MTSMLHPHATVFCCTIQNLVTQGLRASASHRCAWLHAAARCSPASACTSQQRAPLGFEKRWQRSRQERVARATRQLATAADSVVSAASQRMPLHAYMSKRHTSGAPAGSLVLTALTLTLPPM